MIGNRDFAMPYAGRAVFDKNGGMKPVITGDGLENVSSKI